MRHGTLCFLVFALVIWRIFTPGVPQCADPPLVFNRLGLSSAQNRASQGWVFSPLDLDLLPGFAPPLTLPTLTVVGGTNTGSPWFGGGGVYLGRWRLSLYSSALFAQDEEESQRINLFQSLSQGGLTQLLNQERIPRKEDTVRDYGFRLGVNQDRFGLGVSFVRGRKIHYPQSHTLSFPDTEVTVRPGEFFTIISSPTQGQVSLRTYAQDEDRVVDEDLGFEGGVNFADLFALVQLGLHNRDRSREGLVNSDSQGFRSDWNLVEQFRSLDLAGALGRKPSEEGILWVLGGSYRIPLKFTYFEGSFYNGPVPPFTQEEWSREWVVNRRTFRSWNLLALLGYASFHNDSEMGFGFLVLSWNEEDRQDLSERLRLRRVGGSEVGFARGEGGGEWIAQTSQQGVELGVSGGGRRLLFPGVRVVAGASLSWREIREEQLLKPLSLRPVTGESEREGGVLDPLFLPYTPTGIELGGTDHKVELLLALSGGVEISLGDVGSLHLFLIREGRGSKRVLVEFLFPDL